MRFPICVLGWGKGKRRPERMAGFVKPPDMMLALRTHHGQTFDPCNVRAVRALHEDRRAGLGRYVEIQLSDGRGG